MRIASLATALLAMACTARADTVSGEIRPKEGEVGDPLWEAGAGVAGLRFPHYRGSSQSKDYAFPAPYFVYRGEIFKADREGARATFLRNDRVDLNLSLGASFPVKSSDDAVREGMPDLKPSVELGPSLDITLWRDAGRTMKLDLRMPLRAAMTIESSPRFIGGQFYPHVNLDIRNPAGFTGWNLGLRAGPMFTDARNNRYFYEVKPEFATATRPAFSDTGSGYAGAQFLMALSKRFPRFWVGGFARYDMLNGAKFEASPLVTTQRYVAAGLGISWILGESAERVPLDRGFAR